MSKRKLRGLSSSKRRKASASEVYEWEREDLLSRMDAELSPFCDSSSASPYVRKKKKRRKKRKSRKDCFEEHSERQIPRIMEVELALESAATTPQPVAAKRPRVTPPQTEATEAFREMGEAKTESPSISERKADGFLEALLSGGGMHEVGTRELVEAVMQQNSRILGVDFGEQFAVAPLSETAIELQTPEAAAIGEAVDGQQFLLQTVAASAKDCFLLAIVSELRQQLETKQLICAQFEAEIRELQETGGLGETQAVAGISAESGRLKLEHIKMEAKLLSADSENRRLLTEARCFKVLLQQKCRQLEELREESEKWDAVQSELSHLRVLHSDCEKRSQLADASLCDCKAQLQQSTAALRKTESELLSSRRLAQSRSQQIASRKSHLQSDELGAKYTQQIEALRRKNEELAAAMGQCSLDLDSVALLEEMKNELSSYRQTNEQLAARNCDLHSALRRANLSISPIKTDSAVQPQSDDSFGGSLIPLDSFDFSDIVADT